MKMQSVVDKLMLLGSPERAANLSWFFKTGPGQYGEHDKFIGVTVPEQRKIAKEFFDLPLDEVEELLHSVYHECRLTALLILVAKYNKGGSDDRKMIYDLYLKNTNYINNWDLVDLSAGYIVGGYLKDNYRSVLYKLARSKNLWERRIAILSTFYHTKQGKPGPALDVIDILKYDSHDLIQKAVGWMLREVGKRCSPDILREWLLKDGQYKKLPRTTLRYSIEHFGESERKSFLKSEL